MDSRLALEQVVRPCASTTLRVNNQNARPGTAHELHLKPSALT